MHTTTLTKEIAHTVSTIENKEHPEWGTKRFNHNELAPGLSTFGCGCNSAMLFDSDFYFWKVVTYFSKKEI